MYYIHKHEVSQEYGGPEEGGWWYDSGVPVEDWVPLSFIDEERAYVACRAMNEAEHARREAQEEYEYTSVLSSRGTYYSYSVEDSPTPVAFPTERPHYE